MKKLLLFPLFFLFLFQCFAQSTITVDWEENKAVIPKREPDHFYSLPLTFIFDGATFKEKKIRFYSKDKTKIIEAIFDTDISKRTDPETDKPYYRIVLQKDSTLDIMDSKVKIKGVVHFKIEESEFTDPINFKAIKPVLTPDKVNTHYTPGSVIADAIKLRELKELLKQGTANDSIKKLTKYILGCYWITGQDSLSKNRYLQSEFPDLFPNAQSRGTAGQKGLSSVINSAAGLDVTTMADGFAKFIVKRTKQELSIAFFEKFKNELKKYPDLQSVFPQTYRALTAIGEEIYMYEAYIQTLRESFEKDLATLPSNLPSIIDNHEAFFNTVPEVKAILQTGFYVAQEIQNNQHPGNIIENYPVEFLDKPIDPNVKASFQTLQLLSVSLKNNTETDRYWSSYSDIKKLFSNDDALLKIYLGLLEQRARMEKIVFYIKDKKPLSLAQIIDTSYIDIATNLPLYKAYLKNIVLKIQGIETKIAGLKTISSDSLKLENYYSVVSASIDLMKHLTQVEKLPRFPDSLGIQKKTSIYFYITQTSCDMVIDVNRRNYASAIVNATQLYDTIFSYENTKKFIPLFSKVVLSKEDIKKKADSLRRETQYVLHAMFKYGSFMATVAMAKKSEDVAAAIEAIALPTGSARIKRESLFNVSLNAYCGLYLGYEQIKGIDPNWMSAKNSFVNSYGVTVPIGISISKGKSCAFPILGAFSSKHNWSQSLFLSIVDIGALASFRFVDDSTSSVPKVQLKDIVSPGIFYSLGIPKSPLSVNLGWQAGPLLREVTKTQNNYSKSYSRISLSLCVDIPVLNFYNKRDRMKE